MTDNIEAAQVFAITNRGWNHIVDAGGADPGDFDQFEICYPNACIVDGSPTSCWDFIPEIIRIQAQYNDSPDLVFHEIGHTLQFFTFSGNPVAGGTHSFGDNDQDPGIAFVERWPTAFALSACSDGYFNWNEGPYEAAGEWPDCIRNYDYGEWAEGFRYPTISNNRTGEHHEGRVAAAINDFPDAPDDDNCATESRGKFGYADANQNNQISLATIFRDPMWGYDINDFINFFLYLRTSLTVTQQSFADDIMSYNWMSWPITAPWPETLCVASKAAMAVSPDYAAVLKGLRGFRDNIMKLLVEGRKWIQSYYNHSPEMAILLIKNKQARQATGQVIVEHFPNISYRFSEPDGEGLLSDSSEAFLPNNVTESIRLISTLINLKGSDELRQKKAEFRSTLRPFQTLSIGQAMQRISTMTTVRKSKHAIAIKLLDFVPASKYADWELIHKSIHSTEWPAK